MTRSTPEFEPRVADWLEDDPHEAPREVLVTVLAAIPSIRQARRGPFAPWRFSRMTTYSRLAAAAVVAVVAIGGAIYLLRPPVGPGAPTAAPSATPVATATTAPTATIVQAGTITLTDSGCTWAGNPSPIEKGDGRLLVQFTVRNETDTFANFGIYRVDDGTAWADAAAWVLAENAALHGGPSNPPFHSVTDAGNVDAPEPGDYRSQLLMEPGTYGIVCSSNEPPPGLVFAVYLAGPLEITEP